jgi:hypothetical protein
MESPTNPLMNLVDLEGITALAHRYGAIAICDNTFLSPYLLRVSVSGSRPKAHHTPNVTAHRMGEWTAQQLREAFSFDQAPEYLPRDRDGSSILHANWPFSAGF